MKRRYPVHYIGFMVLNSWGSVSLTGEVCIAVGDILTAISVTREIDRHDNLEFMYCSRNPRDHDQWIDKTREVLDANAASKLLSSVIDATLAADDTSDDNEIVDKMVPVILKSVGARNHG